MVGPRLGFVPAGYIINEPSRQVVRTLAQRSQKKCFLTRKEAPSLFCLKGSSMGKQRRAGMLWHCHYLEDLPASADDSTGHTLKVTEAGNTFTDHDSRLYT